MPATIPIENGRGGTGTSYGGLITLGAAARTPMVILHELAHEIVTRHARRPVAAHGPEFAAVLLILVRHRLGAEQADLLRTAFKENRVHHRNTAGNITTEPTRTVPTRTEIQAAARARRRQRPTDRELSAAADTVRRAAMHGMLGATGSKQRAHALTVARACRDAAAERT